MKFFHGAPYDFFATVFGDTVPAVGFHAAGMTFEKEGGDPIDVREHEHYTAMSGRHSRRAPWTARALRAWHASFVDAATDGAAGTLEPNAVFEKGSQLLQPVPSDRVRGYVIVNSTNRSRELAMLVRRLQRMDVKVYQLTSSLTLSSFHPYGDDPVARTFPVGSYWIPLAQGQKNWIHRCSARTPGSPPTSSTTSRRGAIRC